MLPERRPRSFESLLHLLPLKWRKQRVPAQVCAADVCAQQLKALIVVELIPTDGLPSGVVEKRAAELPVQDDRIARQLPLSPTDRLRIDRLLLADAEWIQLAHLPHFDAEDRDNQNRGDQAWPAKIAQEQEKPDDQRRDAGQKEARVPPRVVRTVKTVEDEDHQKP